MNSRLYIQSWSIRFNITCWTSSTSKLRNSIQISGRNTDSPVEVEDRAFIMTFFHRGLRKQAPPDLVINCDSLTIEHQQCLIHANLPLYSVRSFHLEMANFYQIEGVDIG